MSTCVSAGWPKQMSLVLVSDSFVQDYRLGKESSITVSDGADSFTYVTGGATGLFSRVFSTRKARNLMCMPGRAQEDVNYTTDRRNSISCLVSAKFKCRSCYLPNPLHDT